MQQEKNKGFMERFAQDMTREAGKTKPTDLSKFAAKSKSAQEIDEKWQKGEQPWKDASSNWRSVGMFGKFQPMFNQPQGNSALQERRPSSLVTGGRGSFLANGAASDPQPQQQPDTIEPMHKAPEGSADSPPQMPNMSGKSGAATKTATPASPNVANGANSAMQNPEAKRQEDYMPQASSPEGSADSPPQMPNMSGKSGAATKTATPASPNVANGANSAMQNKKAITAPNFTLQASRTSTNDEKLVANKSMQNNEFSKRLGGNIGVGDIAEAAAASGNRQSGTVIYGESAGTIATQTTQGKSDQFPAAYVAGKKRGIISGYQDSEPSSKIKISDSGQSHILGIAGPVLAPSMLSGVGNGSVFNEAVVPSANNSVFSSAPISPDSDPLTIKSIDNNSSQNMPITRIQPQSNHLPIAIYADSPKIMPYSAGFGQHPTITSGGRIAPTSNINISNATSENRLPEAGSDLVAVVQQKTRSEYQDTNESAVLADTKELPESQTKDWKDDSQKVSEVAMGAKNIVAVAEFDSYKALSNAGWTGRLAGKYQSGTSKVIGNARG